MSSEQTLRERVQFLRDNAKKTADHWRKCPTGWGDDESRQRARVCDGWTGAYDAVLTLLAQPTGSQPPLPHWCDRNWDRLRCRVCKAEAWSLADIKHKPDCHIEQPTGSQPPADAHLVCLCGKTRAEHHGCTWFIPSAEQPPAPAVAPQVITPEQFWMILWGEEAYPLSKWKGDDCPMTPSRFNEALERLRTALASEAFFTASEMRQTSDRRSP